VSAMRMPIRAFQHHGLAAVGSCTLPLPPAWLSGCRQQADLTDPACSSAFSRLFLIDQGHSSQNQVRKISLTYLYEPNSSLQMLITAVKNYKIIQLLGETAVSHQDLSNYVG
jgi:hypothetical protein